MKVMRECSQTQMCTFIVQGHNCCCFQHKLSLTPILVTLDQNFYTDLNNVEFTLNVIEK